MSETSIYSKPTRQIEVDVLINGNSIKADLPIGPIEIVKKINEIARASVFLIDGDPTKGDEGFLSPSKVKVGDPIEIKAGYDTETESVFKGVVSGKNIEHNKGENAMVILECYDKAAALLEEKKTEFFNDKSDSEVITKILSDHGLDKSVTISSQAKFEQLVQYKISDWEFIKKRAAINGCIVLTESNKVTIDAPKVSEEAVRTLTYGNTIREHSLTVQDSNQPTKVTASCWDPAQQKLVKATASEPSVNSQGDLTGKKLSENKGAEYILQTTSFLEQEALKAWAEGYLQNLRLIKINGRINTQGDVKFKPDTLVKLEGFGAHYNGNGYIGSVKHSILPGEWDTELELGLPQNTPPKEQKDIDTRISTFPGLQIGVVKQIHEDPENAYRVLVTIPSLPEIQDGIWVRLASPYAPKEKGWFFYPEVGDEVVLGFLEGHPSHAVILGSLFSKKNTAPYKPDEENSTKAIVTKGDLKIEFNDKDLITTISTPEGNEIVLTEKDKKVTITDQTENTIVMSEDGIVITSKGKLELKADKDVTIKGKNVKIEASSALNAEGKDVKLKAKMALEGEGLDVNLKGKKAVAIEGKATAELKASGQTTVKGAILKLN